MSVTHKLEIVLQATTDAFDRGLSKANASIGKFSTHMQAMHKKWTDLPACIVMPCKGCKVQGKRRWLDWGR